MDVRVGLWRKLSTEELIPEWSTGFPYFLQYKSEFGNKECMIWATVSSWSCFCWLYRASPSLAAKIYNLISVLTIWWCPCIQYHNFKLFYNFKFNNLIQTLPRFVKPYIASFLTILLLYIHYSLLHKKYHQIWPLNKKLLFHPISEGQ